MASRAVRYNLTKIYITKDEMGDYVITDGEKECNLTNILDEIVERKTKVNIKIGNTWQF